MVAERYMDYYHVIAWILSESFHVTENLRIEGATTRPGLQTLRPRLSPQVLVLSCSCLQGFVRCKIWVT